MTRIVLLGDVAEVLGGGTPSTKNRHFWGGDIPWITPRDLSTHVDMYISKGERNITSPGLEGSSAKLFPAGSVIFSSRAPIGYVTIARIPMTTNQGCKGIICDEVNLHNKFLYYWLKLKKKHIENLAGGSTFKEISTSGVRNLNIELPDLETQKKVADILGTIDEKIELNRKMNETLERMGQALFRHYFIDNPEAEKWEEGVLGDIIINSDSKRKPLSSRQRADMQGEYRYFGATSVMDYVNDYLFDGTYLLLAEDGSVIKVDGTPYLQYIWGKFWVNNHAHVLQAKMPFTVEYLYLLLSQANVQSLISGAVQLKINQKAMNSFKIKLPQNELVNSFCEKIDPMFAQRRKNEEQIQTLTTLRNTLLPRLINGKVRL